MKYIVVGYLGKYSSMGQWVADGLRENGHDVKAYDRNEEIPNEKAIYFYVDCSEDYSSKIVLNDSPKIFWSMDCHMPGGLERSYNMGSKCDLVISSNYEYGVKMLRQVGIESYLLPITYKGDYFSGLTPLGERHFDVVMIGHPNSPERQQLWEIMKKYKSFCGVANTLQDYRFAMENAKIVINQPTEPFDIILNNRFFEALGSGAILLQKRLKTSLIEKLDYKVGRDFVYWDKLEKLDETVNDILLSIEDYKSMAESGYMKVQKDEFHRQLRKIDSLILSNFYDRL